MMSMFQGGRRENQAVDEIGVPCCHAQPKRASEAFACQKQGYSWIALSQCSCQLSQVALAFSVCNCSCFRFQPFPVAAQIGRCHHKSISAEAACPGIIVGAVHSQSMNGEHNSAR